MRKQRQLFLGFTRKIRLLPQEKIQNAAQEHTTAYRVQSKNRGVQPKSVTVLCTAFAMLLTISVLISGCGAPAANKQAQSTISPSATAGYIQAVAAASNTSMPTPLPTPLPTPSATPEPDPTNEVIKEGITASVVAKIQERLMELGYMEADEPTSYFGPITKLSVELFQRKHGLSIDGSVGIETYTLLMSEQATKYSVSNGAAGIDVKELQLRLRELGYMDSATGYFGPETEAAVRKFQVRNGLAVDGTMGADTREMLYSEEAKANYFERGEVSDKLKKYQERLAKLGYLMTSPDGKYGDDTVAAVKRFQQRNGLIADGYLGPQTIMLLNSSAAHENALILGLKGDDVTKVQKRLKELKYIKNVTGYFGSETENAVRNFQKRNKLSVDGKVGKKTLSTLLSSSAKKASTSSSGSSSGSSSSGGSNSSGGTVNTPDVSDGASVDRFISVAKSKLGSRYVWGSKGPNTFDCSGFVYWCLNQSGVSQGYMTSGMWQKNTKYQRISQMSDLRKGDILSFKGHVGIYLGNGEMINASSSHGKVIISPSITGSSYWNRNFVAGFRVF